MSRIINESKDVIWIATKTSHSQNIWLALIRWFESGSLLNIVQTIFLDYFRFKWFVLRASLDPFYFFLKFWIKYFDLAKKNMIKTNPPLSWIFWKYCSKSSRRKFINEYCINSSLQINSCTKVESSLLMNKVIFFVSFFYIYLYFTLNPISFLIIVSI